MAAGMLGDEAQAARARDGTETGQRSSGSHAGLACTGSKHAAAQRAAAPAAAVA
jgi:hypothetical protein